MKLGGYKLIEKIYFELEDKVELVGLKGGYVSVNGKRIFKIDLDSYISSLKLW